MTNIPIFKPINVKEYDFKQSKYEVAPRLPFSQIIVGPSGSGKGIFQLYLCLYSFIFIFYLHLCVYLCLYSFLSICTCT